jgi:hypothetical protein
MEPQKKQQVKKITPEILAKSLLNRVTDEATKLN